MKLMKKTGSGSPGLGIFIILLSIAAGTYFWMDSVSPAQKEKITRLEGLSDRLRSETVPVKFMILSREPKEASSGACIKARLKLYDLSGKELASLEKSWPGTELFVDMLLMPVASDKDAKKADSWLALPYRVFTDELPASAGTLLFDSYDSAGFPEVLRGADWNAREKESIKEAYLKARKAAGSGLPATDSLKGSFGSAAHEVSSLSKFEEGVVYKVVCRVKGGVEIMED
jgi:hypothetical protein